MKKKHMLILSYGLFLLFFLNSVFFLPYFSLSSSSFHLTCPPIPSSYPKKVSEGDFGFLVSERFPFFPFHCLLSDILICFSVAH